MEINETLKELGMYAQNLCVTLPRLSDAQGYRCSFRYIRETMNQVTKPSCA